MFPFQPRRNPFQPDIYAEPEETPYTSMFKSEEEVPQVAGTFPMRQSQSDSNDRYLADFDKIRGNPGPATSAYKQLATNVPQSSDYAPGKLGRAAAIATGIGAGLRDPSKGFEAAREVVDAPYKTAMRDYSNKVGVTKQAADLEREDAAQQLAALSQARAMGLRYDEYKLKQLEAERKNVHDQGTLDVSRKRADAYIKAQGKSNYDYTPQADGSLLAVNKNDPSDTKTIPADTVAGATLKTNQRNAATNEANAISLAAYRKVMGEAATKRANTSADNAKKPASAFQQAKAYDTALRLLASDPAWSKFVKKDAATPSYYVENDEMVSSPMYKTFLAELRKRIKESLRTGTPLSDDASMDSGSDADIEIIEGDE